MARAGTLPALSPGCRATRGLVACFGLLGRGVGGWHAGRMAGPGKAARDATRLRPVPRWVAPVFAVLGAATVPWTVHLAMSLPAEASAEHYRVAWVGFDVMLIVVLLLTAHAAWRGSRHVGLLAASTATMLVADAWFDVTTSRPADVPLAVLSAVLLELPLAVVCGWIALHVDQVVERRLRHDARRAARLRAVTAGAGARAAQAGAATAGRDGPVGPAIGPPMERPIEEVEDPQ
jgi:hypothetical protein